MLLRVLALTLLLAPLAARGQSAFGDNCHLTIEAEIAKIPFDNALKYGTLVVLTLIPETSPAGLALGREEVANDVRVAALRGAAQCLRDPAQRQRAMEFIAVAKALNDWSGFGGDLQSLTGMSASEILSKATISDAIAADLGAGGLALQAEIIRDLGGGRLPSFQKALTARMDVTREFANQCQWRSAENLSRDMDALMTARRPSAVRDMIRSAQALTGRTMTREADLMALDPYPYINTQARDAGEFISARGDYRLIDQTEADLSRLAQTVAEWEPDHAQVMGRVKQHLGDARRAFEQCNIPRMSSALMLVSREPGVVANTPINRSVNLLISTAMGEREARTDSELQLSLAGNAGCWGDAITTYNDIVTDYFALRDINVPGRDATMVTNALARGQRAVQACDASGARIALREARAALPASLDPGNLCINADQAEKSVDAFEEQMTAGLAACDQPPTAAAAPEEGFLTCPTPPAGYEFRVAEVFGSGTQQPGEIKERQLYNYSAMCQYGAIGDEREAFSLTVSWGGEREAHDHYCTKPPGVPYRESTDTWSLNAVHRTTEEWKGPYTDHMSFGDTFDLVYPSHQRLAHVEFSPYREEVYEYATREWRENGVTQLLRGAAPYAWSCSQ